MPRGSPPRDGYGRQLAYVYLEDGTFVNARLVEHGFALVMTVPPNVKYQDLFLKLQQEAREERRVSYQRKKAKGYSLCRGPFAFLV
ncbi:MAG: thermonuclease family protein [Acidobacteria bacterium]|nr:thermonuclease family protein [Acidobacteriota bacterium]